MTYADKITLARAGYSRAEIEAMDASPATAAQPTTPEPTPAAPEPAPTPATPAEPDPAPVTRPAQAPQSLEASLLYQILGAVQAGNRASVAGTTPPAAASGMDAVRAATAHLAGATTEEV